ncbi:MAG: BrnT family toxin [Pseudomonadota bacterium]
MYNINTEYAFEWDIERELENLSKHGVSFMVAIEVFADPEVIHLEDKKHSSAEDRFYAVGRTSNGEVVTVRYIVRGQTIRIFGAAKWRKWRRFYERENSRSK